VAVDIWTWSGRADNKQIEKKLEQVEQERGVPPILLWTGGNHTFMDAIPEDTATAVPSFLILDGTWQEARAMFRKLPILQSLPRYCIQSSDASIFTLRKDFTGWRERFRSDNEVNLLCTAETVAALLEEMGDCVGGGVIRERLDKFQRNYSRQAMTTLQKI